MATTYTARRVRPNLPSDFRSGDGSSSVSVPYYVEFAERATPLMAINARGVPQPGEPCPFAPNLYYNSASVKTHNAYQYTVTVEFVNRKGGSGSSRSKARPWEQRAEVTVGSEARQVVVEKAYKSLGDATPTIAILNPAGDFFNNPPQITVSDGRFDIRWNVRRASLSSLSRYRNTVNGGAMSVCGQRFAPGQLYLASCDGTPCVTDDGVEYWAMSASILSRPLPDGWKFCPVAAGWKAKINGAVVKPKIDSQGRFVAPTTTDKTAQDITEQVLLDAGGGLLAATQGEMRSATPVFMDFHVIKATDWSQLDIPATR